MRPDDSSVGTGAFEYKEQAQTAPLGEIKKPMSVREAILLAQQRETLTKAELEFPTANKSANFLDAAGL